MKDGLFHQACGFPAGAATSFVGSFSLRYSRHAVESAKADRYGNLPLPARISVEPGDVVELQVVDGEPVKAVVRIPGLAGPGLDLVLVLNTPEWPGVSFVRTVWANESLDNHRSLDRSKYCRP